MPGDEDGVTTSVTGVSRAGNWVVGVSRIEEELMNYGAVHHVTEIYAPPRVTTLAEITRMVPGMAFDFTQMDPED